METAGFTSIEGARILVVEDEYFLADDLARLLRGAGAITIGPLATAAEAAVRLDEAGIDAAILDMNLRGEMAFELAERARRAGIPCLIVSGYSRDAMPPELENVPRVEKPIEPRAVVSAVAALLRKR